MAEEKEPPSILWLDMKTKKIIKKKKNGRLIDCWACPCCKPKVIASKITNARTGPKTWDLTPYQKERIGLPGAKWRLRDVGESHHNNLPKVQFQSANLPKVQFQSAKLAL